MLFCTHIYTKSGCKHRDRVKYSLLNVANQMSFHMKDINGS